MWAAGCRGKYRGIRGRIRYCTRALSLIDLLIIVLSVVFFTVPSDGQIVATSTVRGFRFIQILRMLHVDRQGGTWQLLQSVIYCHRQELLTTAYVGTLGLTISSYLLYLVEKDAHPDRAFSTYADSLWWSLITMTTIGYGDKVPSTTTGRILAAFCALFTVSFFALPAGILGSGFALKVQQQQKRKRFNRQIPAAATLIQCAWRCYATGRHLSSSACWKLSTFSRCDPLSFRSDSSSLFNKMHPADTRTENSCREAFSTVDLIRSENNSFDLTRPQSMEGSVWHRPRLLSRSSQGGRRWSSVGGFPHSDSAPELREPDKENERESELGGNSPTFTTDYEYSITSSHYNSMYREDAEFGAYRHWLTMCQSLTNAERNAVRAIAKMKYYVALKKFQEARRPFDVSDVIEQYSQGYINMTTRIKEMQRRLDNTLGRPCYSASKQREPLTIGIQLRKLKEQMTSVESKMEAIEKKLDRFLSVVVELKEEDNS